LTFSSFSSSFPAYLKISPPGVQIHCKEGLGRLVQSYSSLEAVEGGLADLAAWCLASDKIKLAEMTEGGATHSFFLTVLQVHGSQYCGSKIRCLFFTSGSGIGRKSRSGSRIRIGKEFFVLKSELSKKMVLK
jgi:hypothetical protein